MRRGVQGLGARLTRPHYRVSSTVQERLWMASRICRAGPACQLGPRAWSPTGRVLVQPVHRPVAGVAAHLVQALEVHVVGEPVGSGQFGGRGRRTVDDQGEQRPLSLLRLLRPPPDPRPERGRDARHVRGNVAAVRSDDQVGSFARARHHRAYGATNAPAPARAVQVPRTPPTRSRQFRRPAPLGVPPSVPDPPSTTPWSVASVRSARTPLYAGVEAARDLLRRQIDAHTVGSGWWQRPGRPAYTGTDVRGRGGNPAAR
jgi:hypothetical protein